MRVSTIVALFLFPVMIQASDYTNWISEAMKDIDYGTEKEIERSLKKKPILALQDFLKKDIESSEPTIRVEASQDYIYTEIIDRFSGDYKKAAKLYVDTTLGKRTPNLFIESGAGVSEDIKVIKYDLFDAEFVTDRVYKSSLAFNTKTTTRLKWFDIPEKKAVVIVNELVKDFGAELSKKKVKKESKPYGPVYYDLTIDVYQKVNGKGRPEFIYRSYSMFKGQGMKSSSAGFNMAKKVGNIFSLGTLDKGLKVMIEREASSIWGKRKSMLQKLLDE